MMNRCSGTNYIHRESEKYFYSGENRTRDLDVASVKVEVVSLILAAVNVFFTFLVETHQVESTKKCV